MPSSPSPSSLPLDPSLSPEFNRAISLSLSSALASATHAEQVNSAKLLSVSQLHNYDQFRGMVAGAHLRAMNLSNSPLDAIVSQAGARGTRTEVGAVDGGGGSDAAAWMVEVGRGAMRGKEARLSERRSEELLQESRTATAAAQQPTTPHELKRAWRRLGGGPNADAVRYRYLRALHAAALPGLMKGGAGLEVLGELLDVLSRCCASGTREDDGAAATAAFDLLFHLSRVDRFAISVACLSAQQKQSARQLLDWLHRCAANASHGVGEDGQEKQSEEANGSASAVFSLRFDEAGVAELGSRYKVPRP